METRSTDNPQAPMAGKPSRAPQLTIDQILAWADAHHRATGQWPTRRTGWVRGAPDLLRWHNVNVALRYGSRGLPKGVSLAQLLLERRGVTPGMGEKPATTRPELTVEVIVVWADAHQRATGLWPNTRSGPITGAPKRTWSSINAALSHGRDGLPGGTSLRRLLLEHRGPQVTTTRPDLPVEKILVWADAHYSATGKWPTASSGTVAGACGEHWSRINGALYAGCRGLPGGSSLSRLIKELRPGRNGLTLESILAWGEAHRTATGWRPSRRSGAVTGASGETWSNIDMALRRGYRGLSGGMSLARLFGGRSCVPRTGPRSPLTLDHIRVWGEAHRAATGRWPTSRSGAVAGAPGEKWSNISEALNRGHRGLPAGSSLVKLLGGPGYSPYTGVRLPLSLESIGAWADAHHAATGRWPTARSGAIAGAPGEKWSNIGQALNRGLRGLPAGSSLKRLLAGRTIPAAVGQEDKDVHPPLQG